MSTIGTNIWDYMGKKPKPINEDRLIQAARVNMLGNVFNLIGQAAYGSKDATITPTKDVVTPYVLNRFNEQRQMDIRRGETDRQFMLRKLFKDQEDHEDRLYDQKKTEESRAYNEGLLEKKQAFTEEQNKLWKLTPDQQMEMYGLKGEADLKNYGKRKEIDFAHQVRTARELASIKKQAGEGKNTSYKPVTMIRNKFPLNDTEINALSANVMDLVQSDLDVYDKLSKIKSPAGSSAQNYARMILRSPKDLTPENWTYVIDLLWDEHLKDNYTDLHGELMNIYGGKAEAMPGKTENKSAPKEKTTEAATSDQKKLETDFNKAWTSKVPLAQKQALLVAILVKAGYTKAEAESYIKENYKGK